VETSRLSVPDIEARLRERFGDSVSAVEDRFGDASVTLDAGAYVEAATFLRDEPDLALDFLDFTSAVDRGEEGLEIVTHLFSTNHKHSVRLHVSCPGTEPVCPTLSDVYPSANWHERETTEMFGVRFEGHPQPEKLLLAEPFEGHPLRKDFILQSREVKQWPGDVEGEDEEA
jgi:NADH-quinone oxidoreductase subunit C